MDLRAQTMTLYIGQQVNRLALLSVNRETC
jgi:hypothetical protein